MTALSLTTLSWMTADEEENHIIAPANTPIDPKFKKRLLRATQTARLQLAAPRG